jgi:hypothetical protein
MIVIGRLIAKNQIGASWIPVMILLIFASCATPKPDQNIVNTTERSSVHHEYETYPASRSGDDPSSAADTDSSVSIQGKVSQIDPLVEVAGFWNGGLNDEAAERFHQEDVVSLSSGGRKPEWSFWRGRLFLRQWSARNLGLAEDNISALLLDNDDVWAGTWTGGVVRLSEPLDDAVIWDRGIPSLAVRTVNRIVRSQNDIWVVRYGVVERFDMRSETWSVESDLPVKERLQDLLIQGPRMYLATLGHGLWVMENRNWRQIPEPGMFINRLEEGRDGEMLVATMDRGIFVYRPAERRWIQPPPGVLRSINVTSMLRSGSRIVGGTYGSGAFIWDTEESTVRFFDEGDIGDPWVMAVAYSGGRYHFATFGAGVRSWQPDRNEWDSIGINDGLPSADIVSLAGDGNGTLWAGTLGGGIIRISGGIYAD